MQTLSMYLPMVRWQKWATTMNCSRSEAIMQDSIGTRNSVNEEVLSEVYPFGFGCCCGGSHVSSFGTRRHASRWNYATVRGTRCCRTMVASQRDEYFANHSLVAQYPHGDTRK